MAEQAKKDNLKEIKKEEISDKDISQIISIGKKKKGITYDEIAKELSEIELSPDMMDEVIVMLEDEGVEIIEKKRLDKLN